MKLNIGRKIGILLILLFFALGGFFVCKYNLLNLESNRLGVMTVEENLKNAGFETVNSTIDVTKEKLKEKTKYVKTYIDNLSFDNEITLLAENGTYERPFDETNYSNFMTKFLTKKKIVWQFKYLAILSYPFDKLNYSVDMETGDLIVTYDNSNIKLLALDVKNSTFAEDTSLFESYSNEEILAHQSLAKDEITENFVNQDNLETAEVSLIKFILSDAISNNIQSIVLNNKFFDLQNTKDTQLLTNEALSDKQKINIAKKLWEEN